MLQSHNTTIQEAHQRTRTDTVAGTLQLEVQLQCGHAIVGMPVTDLTVIATDVWAMPPAAVYMCIDHYT